MKVGKHLYDYVKYRYRRRKGSLSNGWKHQKRLAVYVKLPEQFYISTPAGRYMPEWAIALYRETKENVSLLLGKKPEKIKTLISQK
mgnify:CR=1 FL=1